MPIENFFFLQENQTALLRISLQLKQQAKTTIINLIEIALELRESLGYYVCSSEHFKDPKNCAITKRERKT